MPPDPPSKCVLCTHIVHKTSLFEYDATAKGLSTFYLLPTGLHTHLHMLFMCSVLFTSDRGQLSEMHAQTLYHLPSEARTLLYSLFQVSIVSSLSVQCRCIFGALSN